LVHERMALYTAYMLLCFSLVLNSSVSTVVDGEGFWTDAATLIGFLGALLFVLFMLIFPDGRFVPRWAVWLPRLFILWFISWFFLPQFGPANQSNDTINLVVAAWMVTAISMQVYRYLRVSNVVERQQTKWVAFSLLLLLSIETLSTVAVAIAPQWEPFGPSPLADLLAGLVGDLLWLIFPAGLVIAMLRYRLWEIDRLINKALVYSVLTLVLGSLYMASVMGLQALFSTWSGQSSGAAAVISTLGVAALFNPLRGQVQAAIDRRFYRQKYDAERILAAFGEAVRSEVSLERLGEQLTAAVEQTLQPETLSLWLVGPGARRQNDEAAWRMLLELDE
ncbi:MAG: hypothetical protein ACKOC5_01805, partial [Chloroflexota bacterium]